MMPYRAEYKRGKYTAAHYAENEIQFFHYLPEAAKRYNKACGSGGGQGYLSRYAA